MTGSESEGTPVPDTYAAYEAGRDAEAARFTDWLRQRAEPAWSTAITHRFPRELGRDELDDAVFRQYLVQDYAFLETLVGVVGHAVGDAPSMAAKARLADFLGTLTDEENDYFERSFAALDVPTATDADPERTPTTRAFEDLLERAAREGGYGETLAVLLPAEWIYRSWATNVDGQYERPSRFYLAEWIDLHANPAFESFVAWLRTELDREGVAASGRRRQRIDRLFRRTVTLEEAFFGMAYERDAGVGWDGSPGGSDAGQASEDTTATGGDDQW